MFVLMDIEWIGNLYYGISPTQMAAMRVDEQWNSVDSFFSRVFPEKGTSRDWSHVAYTGGTCSDYLQAPCLHTVLEDLRSWLREDDVICFWCETGLPVFQKVCARVLGTEVSQKMVLLQDYVFPFLVRQQKKPGSAYRVCKKHGQKAAGPKHNSENDVAAMQKALRCMQYPSALLHGEPPAEAEEFRLSARSSDAMRPYQMDISTNLVHKSNCSAIAEAAALTGFMDLRYFFRKRLKACPLCLQEEARKANRERNRDIISRTNYQFVYAENSAVFHRRDCSLILSTTAMLKGSVGYSACANTGRRPCKFCKPTASAAAKTLLKKPPRKGKTAVAKPSIRTLSSAEMRAVARYKEARAERVSASATQFRSETEKNDFYTLTQPRFAFFCGMGYQNFHRRNCQRLHGLTNIIGFSKYKDAVRSGHTPCKLCRPTAKLNADYAIPITNMKRKGESVSDLETLCAEQGYPYENIDQYFCFLTPVGRWKIDVSFAPYAVLHINRVMHPQNEYDYHRQPWLFLSLQDAFTYIRQHDKQLQERCCGSTPGI